MTDSLTELRTTLDTIKAESGTGSKQRKQDAFTDAYSANVGHLITGERYDAAGVGPSTAKKAARQAFYEVEDGPTLSESLADADVGGDNDSTAALVERLDAIAEESGNDQLNLLVATFEEFTQPSIVSLALLDDESIGLGTSQMREAFVPELSRAERKRAESLCDGTVDFITRAKNDTLPTEPEVMTPFAPMLAKPESAGRPDDAVAQAKIDGYRILLHVSNQQARAYTRRQKDVTHSLPELQEIEWPEGDYILDGEVIAEDGTYKTTSQRVGSKAENIDHSEEMEFALFDVILSNGEDMTQQPYKQRYQKLNKLVTQAVPDSRVYSLEASSNIDEVKEYARREGFEGVIIKNLYGEYEFGTRSSEWVKEKHEAETVDVVAVGFDEGEGRLDGTLGRVELASADGVPLGYTGSGFSDEQRDEVWSNRDEYRNATLEVEGEAFDDGIRFPIFQRWRTTDGEPDGIDRIKEILGGSA